MEWDLKFLIYCEGLWKSYASFYLSVKSLVMLQTSFITKVEPLTEHGLLAESDSTPCPFPGKKNASAVIFITLCETFPSSL